MALALVTGGTGFIGSHLIEALVEQGLDVRCLIRNSSKLAFSHPRIRFHLGDLSQEIELQSALKDASFVYHLAGLNRALRFEDLLRVNEHGAGRMAQACAGMSNPPVLLHLSSLAAVGPTTRDILRSPSDIPRPISNYGRSKLAGESKVAKFANNVPITIVRPPTVFGERDRDCFQVFQPVARMGIHSVIRGGRARVSLIHVKDLVQGMILAAQQARRLDPSGQDQTGTGRYFMADDHHPEIRELGAMIGTALGRQRVRVISAPAASAWLLGLLGEIWGRLRRSPTVLNWDKARELTAGSWTCDPASAKLDFGFSTHESLEDRLKQTADWYRAQRWL